MHRYSNIMRQHHNAEQQYTMTSTTLHCRFQSFAATLANIQREAFCFQRHQHKGSALNMQQRGRWTPATSTQHNGNMTRARRGQQQSFMILFIKHKQHQWVRPAWGMPIFSVFSLTYGGKTIFPTDIINLNMVPTMWDSKKTVQKNSAKHPAPQSGTKLGQNKKSTHQNKKMLNQHPGICYTPTHERNMHQKRQAP